MASGSRKEDGIKIHTEPLRINFPRRSPTQRNGSMEDCLGRYAVTGKSHFLRNAYGRMRLLISAFMASSVADRSLVFYGMVCRCGGQLFPSPRNRTYLNRKTCSC